MVLVVASRTRINAGAEEYWAFPRLPTGARHGVVKSSHGSSGEDA